MRARLLHAIQLGAALAGTLLVPSACDSTLNLGGGDGGTRADAPFGFDGGAAATCADVCEKVVACGFVASDKQAGCVSDCAKGAPPGLLDCVARTACAEMQSVCSAYIPDASFGPFAGGLDGFEIGECQSACDSIHFFDCFTASETATCRDLCSTAPAAKRNTFASCGHASPSNCEKSKDCYGVFVGD